MRNKCGIWVPGRPRKTRAYTMTQLKAEGYVGLYERLPDDQPAATPQVFAGTKIYLHFIPTASRRTEWTGKSLPPHNPPASRMCRSISTLALPTRQSCCQDRLSAHVLMFKTAVRRQTTSATNHTQPSGRFSLALVRFLETASPPPSSIQFKYTHAARAVASHRSFPVALLLAPAGTPAPNRVQRLRA